MDLFWGVAIQRVGAREARNNLCAQIRQIVSLKRRIIELPEVFVSYALILSKCFSRKISSIIFLLVLLLIGGGLIHIYGLN